MAGSVVTFLDISQRRHLEDQFRQSQQRLRHIIVSSPAVLFTLSIVEGDFDLTWISAAHGWALAADPSCQGSTCSRLLTTTDSGATWSPVGTLPACLRAPSTPATGSAAGTSCPPGTPTVSSLRFATATIGYAFGPDLLMTLDYDFRAAVVLLDRWLTEYQAQQAQKKTPRPPP